MGQNDPVVVIGSGFGGLAAAVRMRAKGYPVLVLEARDQPGGRASVFLRDGYSFDAGPTVITAPYLFEELFELVGRDWRDYYELMEVDPFYRIEFDDGSRFDYVGDEERLIEQIRAFNPKDVDGYYKFADHSRRIFDVGYVQLADAPDRTQPGTGDVNYANVIRAVRAAGYARPIGLEFWAEDGDYARAVRDMVKLGMSL